MKKNKEIKKQFFARKDEAIENTFTPKEKKAETVKDEQIKKAKEIEIPTPMDATKEIEISTKGREIVVEPKIVLEIAFSEIVVEVFIF